MIRFVAFLCASAVAAPLHAGELFLATSDLGFEGDSALFTHDFVEFTGYTIECEAGCLDPIAWRSIADRVAEDPLNVVDRLSAGAVSFVEVYASSNRVGEAIAGSSDVGAVLQSPRDSILNLGKLVQGTVVQVVNWVDSGVLRATATVLVDGRAETVDLTLGALGPIFPLGDLDFDLVVDLNDFELFKSNFNLPLFGRYEGDLNFDGFVDLKDFAIFKDHFGASVIPEPPAMVIGLFAALGVAFVGRLRPRARRTPS